MAYSVILYIRCNIFVALLLLAVIAAKRLLRKNIDISMQYTISRLVLITLLVPFIPLDFSAIKTWVLSLQNSRILSGSQFVQAGASVTSAIIDLPGVYASDLGQTSFTDFFGIIKLLWCLGAITIGLYYIHAFLKMHFHVSGMKSIKDHRILVVLQECKKLMGFRNDKRIKLVEGIKVTSPMTFGVMNRYIALPSSYRLGDENIKYALLHELCHIKRLDMAYQYLMVFIKTIYWINPLVWLFISETAKERELACDAGVLRAIGEESGRAYGYALIRIAAQKQERFSPALMIVNRPSMIKRRIQQIASFHNASRFKKIRGIVTVAIIFALIFFNLPFLTVFSSNHANSLSADNVAVEDSLGSYFTGYTGAFVLYDTSNDIFTVYNPSECLERYAAASTFKIHTLLLALNENIVTKDASLMEWDGTDNFYPEWNTDLDMASAMKASANWYFDRLDKALGYYKLQEYVDKAGYGNRDLTGGIGSYWGTTLAISTVEQVKMLSQMLATEKNMNIVKSTMRLDAPDGIQLYGKTGTQVTDNQISEGWFIGFIEREENRYIFAVHISDGEDPSGATAVQITNDILAYKGVMRPAVKNLIYVMNYPAAETAG